MDLISTIGVGKSEKIDLKIKEPIQDLKKEVDFQGEDKTLETSTRSLPKNISDASINFVNDHNQLIYII